MNFYAEDCKVKSSYPDTPCSALESEAAFFPPPMNCTQNAARTILKVINWQSWRLSFRKSVVRLTELCELCEQDD